MKKIINNYYNLYPDKIYKKEKNITYFFINNNKCKRNILKGDE